ncbi:hypothetical protein [Lysinibacillus fusiformis]|uniref:hypothetical protein n=1 Tax=Lysinibacillus fusiformis TaxID=28031 RepID=UPI003D07A069
MKIQSYSSTLSYFKTEENRETKDKNILDLFLNEDEQKDNKPKFEVRNENGYICKYIVKANGEKTLIMRVKQTQNMKENESGSLTDIANDMLMKQLEKPPYLKTQDKHNISTLEKENNIFKYKTGI